MLTVTGPINQPPSDQFRGFDDESNSLMNSLTNLDAEDEPRRGLGAASRANSVRFDETANQNHFTHSSRPSFEFLSRSSSGGLGGLQMNERSSSHKSEGRASSAHSMRSAASGRANSLNMESTHAMNESKASPSDAPTIAPGMFLLGSVPAIIRCWMNMHFKHDALLYAAVCTGSHKSFIDLRLVQKLGYATVVRQPNEEGVRTVRLPIFFPEAVPSQPISMSRAASPAHNLPTLTMDFQVVENTEDGTGNSIQVFLGSDMLRAHSADIMFSSNNMTLFDDTKQKVSVPLVRPENESTFKSLYVTSGTPAGTMQKQVGEQVHFNGVAQGSSTASVSSSATSPRPQVKYRPPGALATETAFSADSVKAGAGTGSDSELRPASRQSSTSRPSLNVNTARPDTQQDIVTQTPDTAQTTTPLRSGPSPAIWSNWRRDANPATTPATATPASAAGGMDWASTSRGTREAPYQRRDTGIKVLKPKSGSRTFSTSTSASATTPAAGDGGSAKGSRFFDDGRAKGEDRGGSVSGKNEEPVGLSAEKKTKGANPIGAGSAFRWMP